MNEKFTIYLAGSLDVVQQKCEFVGGRLNDWSTCTFIDPSPKSLPLDGVVTIDKRNITNSDIVIAFINKCTFGTTMEILYAHQFGTKLVYVINKNQKFKDDIWLNAHIDKYFTNIEECQNQVMSIIRATSYRRCGASDRCNY